MRDNVKHFRFAISGLILGIIVIIVNLIFDIDFFEIFIGSVQKLKEFKFDEIFILFALLLIGLAMDFNRFHIKVERSDKVQKEKLYIFKITMVTVTDIVFNALHGLRLIQHDLETENPDNQSIKIMDKIITTTTTRLRALSAVEEVKMKKVGEHITVIDYNKEE